MEAGLAHDERLSETLGRPAFHASQTCESTKRLGIEPIFGALCTEVLFQQLDLPVESCRSDRYVQIRAPNVAVPLWYLILENEVIAERVPGELGHLAMVLMSVVPFVGQNNVGGRSRLQVLDKVFDLATLIGEVAVLCLAEFDCRGGGSVKKRCCRPLRLLAARSRGA